MDRRTEHTTKESLGAADSLFANLSPSETGGLISAAADVALILDSEGRIEDASFGADELDDLGFDDWPGQSWFDIVTRDSRPKLKDMLDETGTARALRWRQVTHPTKDGTEVPIRYMTVSLGDGRVLAIGRNMQPVAALQQRLVEAQLTMEREYARMRRAETRYRLLFQLATEPVLIVDAASHKVVEANPAAAQLLGRDEKKLNGTAVSAAFDPAGRASLQDAINRVRENGGQDGAVVVTAEDERRVSVRISSFRQEGRSFFLVRMNPADAVLAGGPSETDKITLSVIESAPDGFVVTDMAGDILRGNSAFLDMAQVGGEDQLKGRPISRWLGRSNVDLNVLMANLKEHGTVRMFATQLRNEFGGTQDVEISAVAVSESDPPCIGFMIRSQEGRLSLSDTAARTLPGPVEHLSHLVGRMPLKDLVQESTDIIERLCIEAALELTGNNRASAAEMLGLSRQSL
jgi:transcriptional regulator PpsR